MRKILFGLTFMSVFLVTNALAQPEIIRHPINDHANGNADNSQRIFAVPTAGSTRSTTALRYHGGPVITTPSVYIIWYGNWNQTNGTDTPAGQQIIRDWAAGIGSSDYFRINATYSQKPVSGTALFGGEWTYSGSVTTTSLADSNILTIVNDSINAGLAYNPNGVYLVVTSSNVNETSGFCTNYCGWHTAGTATKGHVRYGFVGNAARCLNACAEQTVSPNGNAGVDGAISVLSHELEEATTDPDPLSGWADSRGQENGDKCAWTFGNTTRLANGSYSNMSFNGRNWLIQRNLWYNGSWFCANSSTGSQTGVFN